MGYNGIQKMVHAMKNGLALSVVRFGVHGKFCCVIKGKQIVSLQCKSIAAHNDINKCVYFNWSIILKHAIL